MSAALDTNILLYASNDKSELKQVATQFLDDLAQGPDLVYIPWPVAMGYMRISTHPRIFPVPIPPEKALDNLRSLLERPNVGTIGAKTGFLDAYAQVTGKFPVRGDLVTDAHIATVLLQHGVRRIYTRDSDFRRFDFLEARNPFS